MQTTTVRVLDREITIEQIPQPFAHVLDRPGHLAVMVYEFMVEGVSPEDWGRWSDATFDAGPKIEYVRSDDHLVLPMLTEDAAEEVAQHAYFSGADLHVTAQVRAHRGEDAMHDYADTQNMYSMPGAPKIPEDELRWIGSGL